MARLTRFLLDILHIRPKRTQKITPKISRPIPISIPREPTPDMPFPTAKDPYTHHQRFSTAQPTIQSPLPASETEADTEISQGPYTHANISQTALLPTFYTEPSTPAPASRPRPHRRASARHSKPSRVTSQRRQSSYFTSGYNDLPSSPGVEKLSPSERFSRSYVVTRGEGDEAERRKLRLSRRVSVGLQTYGTHGRVYAP